MHNGNLRPRIISLTILCVVRFCQMIAEKEIVMSKRTLNQTQTDSIYLERWFPPNPTPKILERKEGGGDGRIHSRAQLICRHILYITKIVYRTIR